jgi:hypothetical protein
MNMATIACDRVVSELIEPETGVSCIALSGNYCVDKKPAAINFQEGRGKRVFAEVVLPEEVMTKTLKTTAKALVDVQYRKNLLGSIAAGSSGFNAHYANVLAAFFIACGQDLAHVVEGSMGVTCIEEREDGAAYMSIYLPAIPLGAVGGGTTLDTQAEAPAKAPTRKPSASSWRRRRPLAAPRLLRRESSPARSWVRASTRAAAFALAATNRSPAAASRRSRTGRASPSRWWRRGLVTTAVGREKPGGYSKRRASSPASAASPASTRASGAPGAIRANAVSQARPW